MKSRFFLLFFVLIVLFPAGIFSQQAPAALRDYVGLINQTYHPGVVSFFEGIKANLERRGESDAVRAIDIFLRGSTGSGFVVSDRGNLYVITNNHVIAQAHTVSITFERPDGFRRTFENLRIIAANEENDLAILAFAPGDRPVQQGLSLLTRAAREGETVFSAGFPSLGITPIWQFGQGMVSNASVRFPRSIQDETQMGPYIQHTAQIDPGNSGGPLLVAQQGVATGYAVVGINTLTGLRRQAANYAIPVSTTQSFMTGALNQRPDTFRAALDQRLAEFVEGLGVNRAVYPHIAGFLSAACVGENAEYAMEEMFERSNASVRRAFIEKTEDGVVGAMSYAVAWTIENSIRTGPGALRTVIKDVTGAGEEYTVVFTINNTDHSSRWVREYGNWRIRTFGAVAAGDADLLTQRQSRREAAQNLRIDDSNVHLEAGYANLFDKASFALYASADFGNFGAKVYFADSDFWAIGAFVNYRWGIPAGNLGFMPYLRLGADYMFDKEYNDFKDEFHPPAITGMGQAGLKVTTSYVPGLFIGAAFQFNFFNMANFLTDYENAMKMAFAITAGYAF